jgi:squalene/oxidosqualene cyclase-like protein
MSEQQVGPAKAGRAEASPTEGLCERAISHALVFLGSRQEPDGAWRGDYGGPMFLLPMYLAAHHIGGRPVEPRRREGMVTYLRAAQHADGSFGLHIESSGCLFTTVLSYVAFRLLGLPPDDERVALARAFILGHGTALACASWGKFVLALLNLYDYEGLAPILPELWLLPARFPLHPSHFWCHTRQVYLPMAHLYGMKAQMPADELTHALRRELYDRPYDSICFADHRNTIAADDVYAPASWPLKLVNRILGLYERVHLAWLRKRALTRLAEHIDFEDRATHFIRIGPVNAVLNTLVHCFRSPHGEATKRSFATLEGYLCDGHDGTKMNGYNSTALWDTAFATQAILATTEAGAHGETLRGARTFIVANQVLEDLPDYRRYHRHPSRGGWPFSDREHGWPITDCTAEGLSAALLLETVGLPALPDERIRAAVELILSWQNSDGGWATYERQRGGRWLEVLNPSHVFGDIMVDRSYPECTSACLASLALWRRRFAAKNDSGLARRVAVAMRRGEIFLRQAQRDDGSWEGSWGVCFTYGTWFGVRGLGAASAPTGDPALERACAFLYAHQNADGGWGESGTSCAERRYVGARSHAVNTAWALLALTGAGQANDPRCARAAHFLVASQVDDGDWPRQALSGVFNKTTLINYENYRRYFPLWALAVYCNGNPQRVPKPSRALAPSGKARLRQRDR